MPEYSIVTPVHNEEESLEIFLGEVRAAMDSLRSLYEIIFVNDGSTDRSKEILQKFQQQWPHIVRMVDLPVRSGQTFAMKSGVQAATGQIIITIDADLQNDPADIPRLLAKMREGYDVVCGWRKARQDKPLKACLSKGGNLLQRLLTGLNVHDVSCTLRVYKRECFPKIGLNWEGQHRFIPLILSLHGFRVGEIVSHHRRRQFGYTKYNHRRIMKVGIDFFRILIFRGK